MSKPDESDQAVKKAAALLVMQFMQSGEERGYSPEFIWATLALATNAAESALIYTMGVMKNTGPDYAKAKERIDRLLVEAVEAHTETAKVTDDLLHVKRGAPE